MPIFIKFYYQKHFKLLLYFKCFIEVIEGHWKQFESILLNSWMMSFWVCWKLLESFDCLHFINLEEVNLFLLNLIHQFHFLRFWLLIRRDLMGTIKLFDLDVIRVTINFIVLIDNMNIEALGWVYSIKVTQIFITIFICNHLYHNFL